MSSPTINPEHGQSTQTQTIDVNSLPTVQDHANKKGADVVDYGKDESETTSNKFCVDYSKRGTAKCKVCRKCIPKEELRIGMYACYKNKVIINYT